MKSRSWFPVVIVLPAVMLCAFSFAYRASVPDATGHGGDERTIRQLNEECLHAHDIGDLATLDRIEDPDFTISGDFGVGSKRQHLDKVRHRTKKTEVITRKIDPQHFRLYDNVALLTETDRPATAEGTFAFQSTEVWVRRGTEWKLAHLHYSQLEEKK